MRLVEQRAHVGAGDVDPTLVALKPEDLVGVDGQGDVAEDLSLGRMCSGFEPQQAPTMLQPAASSAGYSRAIASGSSSYVTVSPVVTGSPALG